MKERNCFMELKVTKGWTNVKGSGDWNCNCGSWKKHWLIYSRDFYNMDKLMKLDFLEAKYWPEQCSVAGCENVAEDGAHVKNPKLQGQWIIPMCKTHNNPDNEDIFEIKKGTYRAPANKEKTCERKSVG